MSQVKKKKFSCKFKPEWVEKFGNEVKSIPGNQHFFFCVICDKAIYCEHMGEADVSRHILNALHKKNKLA